jgi:tetratricopeptide (TPR) repeat protein
MYNTKMYKMSIQYVSLLAQAIVSLFLVNIPVCAAEGIGSLESSSSNARIDELFNSSLAKLRQNRPDEARALLIEASRLAPSSAGIHCNLGLAQMQLANLDEAISEFHLSLKYVPTMIEAMLNLAECYRLQDKLDQSIEWYQNYLELRPNDASVRQTLETVMKHSKLPASEKFGSNYLREAIASEMNRWPKGKKIIAVYFDRSTKVPGFRNEFIGVMRDCLTEWSNALGGRIQFTESPLERNADLVCRWIYQPKLGRNDLLLNERGNATLTAHRGEIFHATIKLLTAPSLIGSDVSEDVVRKTCLHEIGHALGIAGHSPNNTDVMFYLVESPTVQTHLTDRDKQTIAKLYDLN